MSANGLMQQQLRLEELFNKNQVVPRIRTEFEQSEELYEALRVFNIPKKLGMDMMTYMVILKRLEVSALIGLLRHHCATAQEIADHLHSAAEAGLIHWDHIKEQFVILHTVSKEVQDDVDRYQYPLPMVVRPKHVKSNRGYGYFTDDSSVILKDNHHDKDVCLDHLNRSNKVEYSLDMETAYMIQNQWKGLDKIRDGETKMDLDKRRKAFQKYDRNSKVVLELLTMISDKFYLTHRYDKRGRTYAQGYHVNPQGNSWNKAIINFANKEVI